MLEDMGNSGIVRGVCLETDGENIITVITGNVKVIGTGLVMLEM